MGRRSRWGQAPTAQVRRTHRVEVATSKLLVPWSYCCAVVHVFREYTYVFPEGALQKKRWPFAIPSGRASSDEERTEETTA